MLLKKPENFDGIIFLQKMADNNLVLKEVIDNGEGYLIVNLDDKDKDLIAEIVKESIVINNG